MKDEEVTAHGAGSPLEATEKTSGVNLASSALSHRGQLLTLLGARSSGW